LVEESTYADPAPGVRLAIVLVRCNAGAGTPPVALYVYDKATSRVAAHLAETLIKDSDNWQAGAVNAAGTTISLEVAGFSSNNVPNCCPDVQAALTWEWDGTRYRLTSDVPPHITGLPRGYY